MLASPLPLPYDRPASITRVLEEPDFDPRRHLALEMPERIWSLEEFGYDAAVRARTPSPVAITSVFRVLSDEGVAALQFVLRSLKSDQHVSTGRRLSVFLTGGVYRSRFLRDLVSSPLLVEHFSRIAGTELMPHPLPQLQAYVNYAPEDPTKSVDNWHVDSLGYDAVMMVSDPSCLKGGKFEYFEGSFAEVMQLVGAGSEQELTAGWENELPAERVRRVAFPAAGHAVFMQGDHVFHRAAQLEAPGERITVVPGYMARDLAYPDRTKTVGMQRWRDGHLLCELERHAAWLPSLSARAPLAHRPDRLGASAFFRSPRGPRRPSGPGQGLPSVLGSPEIPLELSRIAFPQSMEIPAALQPRDLLQQQVALVVARPLHLVGAGQAVLEHRPPPRLLPLRPGVGIVRHGTVAAADLQRAQQGRQIEEALGDQVDHQPLALHLAADPEQRGPEHDAPVLLEGLRPDHRVGDAGLVLQGGEDHALGAARTLAHQHQAGQWLRRRPGRPVAPAPPPGAGPAQPVPRAGTRADGRAASAS